MESLIGLALPPLIQIINKDVKNSTEKYIVAFMVCVSVAVMIDWKEFSQITMMNLFQTIAIIATESQVVYNLYWKNSALNEKLQQKISPVALPEAPAQG